MIKLLRVIVHRKREIFTSLLTLCDHLQSLIERGALLRGQVIEESVASVHFDRSLGPLDIRLVEQGLDLGVSGEELRDECVLVVAWDFTVNVPGQIDIVCRGFFITIGSITKADRKFSSWHFLLLLLLI